MSLSVHFKGFTPRDVWDLTYTEWVIYASASDDADAEYEKRAREARSSSRGRGR